MKYEYSLILRLIVILLIPLKIFYVIFTPLTIFPSYFLLKLFNYEILMSYSDKYFVIGNYTLDFVPACIAASAYYLLFLLILATKDIKLRTRINMFLLGSLLILAMNIIRVEILIIALVEYGKTLFESIHLIFWRFVSVVYVFFVWIFLIKRYKVKSIPVYSDLRMLYKKSLFKKE